MLESLTGSLFEQNAWIETTIRAEHAKRFGHATKQKKSLLHAHRMTTGGNRRAAIAKLVKNKRAAQESK